MFCALFYVDFFIAINSGDMLQLEVICKILIMPNQALIGHTKWLLNRHNQKSGEHLIGAPSHFKSWINRIAFLQSPSASKRV